MTTNGPIGQYVLQKLKEDYEVNEISIGSDAKLDKGLMHFTVKRYDVKDIGNLCLLNMTGVFGLMKMETVVLSCFTKDVPLVNFDTVDAMGNRTQMAEFYDTKVAADNTALAETCQAIKDADADIPDYSSGEHWYDSLLYPYSYAKKTKGKDPRTETSCLKYADAFLEELKRAEACDPAAKKEKIRSFAQSLLDNGGPAVNQMRKMFGEETAKRLVLQHMYGAE